MSSLKNDGLIELNLNKCEAWELSLKVKGVGISLGNRMITERNQNGEFNDWNDLRKRVYGVGLKTIEKMKQANVKIIKQNKGNGFIFEYVDLGPDIQIPEHLKPKFSNLHFCMQNNITQNDNSDKS